MRKYRMYGLVPYNLSPIQQGIQFGHAVQEYNNMILTGEFDHLREAYDRWRLEDKTFIILNGGTTNNNPDTWGTINKFNNDFNDHGVITASFREPDLGDQLTAFVFLVDDRVWDKENWPDYEASSSEWFEQKEMIRKSGDKAAVLESFESYRIWFNNFSDDYREAERIVFLRDFLRNFKLA